MARIIFGADRTVVFHGQAGVTEHLGQAGPEVKDPELWAWMTTLVSHFDTISTPEGQFVVLRTECEQLGRPPVRFAYQPGPKGRQ